VLDNFRDIVVCIPIFIAGKARVCIDDGLIGKTPTLVARLKVVAEPNMVVFEYEELGKKGP
jgi:hypothetical protein